MLHNKCKYCDGRFGGEEGLDVCFGCWELHEEMGGPQRDPDKQ